MWLHQLKFDKMPRHIRVPKTRLVKARIWMQLDGKPYDISHKLRPDWAKILEILRFAHGKK